MNKLLIMALIVMVVLLSGCTYNPQETPQEQQATPAPAVTQTATASETMSKEGTIAQEVSIDIKGFAFNPSTITIKKGTTVIWTQQDSTLHTVTGTGLKSGNLAKGQTFSHTFNDVGTFDYHCSIHPSMTGKVIVE